VKQVKSNEMVTESDDAESEAEAEAEAKVEAEV